MSNISMRSLKKMTEDLDRMERYANYKKIGYEPKCKICNSEYQNQVEALKEDDYTLEEMKEFLEGNGEDVSIMSLSRHFERHYPTRKAYLMGIDEEKAQRILEGEKAIERDLKYHPEFEEILESSHSYYDFDENGEYKEFTEKGRDIYIFKHGYCITGGRFCKLVPKLKYMGGNEVTDNLKTELFKIEHGLINDWMNEKKLKMLEDSLECTNCQAFYHECVTSGLLNLILNEGYGVEMELEEFNDLCFQTDFIYEEMDEELKKYAAKKNEKALES